MQPSRARMLWRGLTRHCPRCGSGHLFRHWVKMVPDCPRCGLHFEGRPEEGHFLGAITINTGLTAGTIILGIFIYIVVLATSQGGGPPVWFVVVTSAALAVILPTLFYPFTKTIWVAAEIWMNRFDSGR